MFSSIYYLNNVLNVFSIRKNAGSTCHNTENKQISLIDNLKEIVEWLFSQNLYELEINFMIFGLRVRFYPNQSYGFNLKLY